MTSTVFLLVILAAFLHAGWNVLVKFNVDRFVSLFLLQTLMGVFGIGMVVWAGFPNQTGWIYAIISGFLHTGYNLFLARSYKTGDLSLVYPLARGGAPFLTLLGTIAVLQEVPAPLATLGIIILLAGLLLVGLSGVRHKTVDRATLFFAGGTAVFIAIYTVVDGMGGRVSGDPIAYAGLVFILDGLFLFVTGLVWRGPEIMRQAFPLWKAGIIGAGASSLAYGIVIWAMSQAPIAAVAALRETSIVFALAMSARYLKETLTLPRVLGAILIAAGAVLLRIG